MSSISKYSTPVSAPSGVGGIGSVAQIANTDTTTNLNTGSPVIVPLGGKPVIFDQGYSLVNNGIAVNFNGRVEVLFSVLTYSNSARTNLLITVLKNGVPVGPSAAMGYIRSASDHNMSSYSLPPIAYDCEDGDVFEVQALREANSGSVTLAEEDGSLLQLKRIR